MIKQNVDITKLSNFQTFAKAKYFYEFTGNIGELKKALTFQKENNLNILFIGGGTNLLFAFDFFDGIVVKINEKGFLYNKKTKELQVGAGEIISDISESLENDFKNDLRHRFIGLPGTVGGAIFGNAGCFGLEISSNFVECLVYNLESGIFETLKKNDMYFDYRTSILKKTGNYIVLNAKFDLLKKIEKYSSDVDNIYFRKHKQPSGFTCGSCFKNPSSKNPAGKLIENVGLKGYNKNGAFFSELHGNFLMSDGTANYQDLINMIDLAKKKVKKKYNLDLELEIRIISNI